MPIYRALGCQHINQFLLQGRPQDLAGRGAKFFFQIWVFACREAMRFVRGVRGHAPPEKFFFKWCNLVRFGVYFDQILSLKIFLNYHFLYKNFKNCNFLYKRINILDTRNIILAKILMRFGIYFEIILNKKWLFSCRNTY